MLAVGACSGEPRPAGPDTGPADAEVAGDGAGPDGDADADDEADGTEDADHPVDAGPDALPCPANGDGVLDRREVVVGLGVPLLYRVQPLGTTVPVDLVGSVEDGVRTWRFESPLEGERVVEETASAVDGSWFASDFPDATHAAPLSEEHGTLGVYRLEEDALRLLGMVSADDPSTLVVYTPPVPLLRFPLRWGDSWTATTTGTGRVGWVSFFDFESYEIAADSEGVIVVPAGRFPVLRVRAEVTQTVGLLQLRRIAYSFMGECWGRVAQVTSRDDERQAEFAVAADYRRLAFE